MALRRPIFLTGMMGTGKSTLGEAIASRAGLPFVDLDRRIEDRFGLPVSQIFAERGEAAFRVVERELLDAEIEDKTPRVVALGGGALLDREIRLRALEHAFVVGLSADAKEILRRLGSDTKRPLLRGGERESRLRSLLQQRQSVYKEVHVSLDTTSRGILELAMEVLALAGSDRIAVALGERSYVVEIATGQAKRALSASLARLRPTRIVLVTDETVRDLVLPELAAPIFEADPNAVEVVLPPGEKFKTLASLETVLRAAIEVPIDRRALIVAVGGGVITDLGGLAAALALRGIRWLAIPTTTLAMVDASVGGKTAVDLGGAKNAVGAFHQPAHVIVDSTLAKSETERGFRSGLAEVVKSALIGSPDLWRELLEDAEQLTRQNQEFLARAIRASIQVKASIVSRDELESGERIFLNLGHTVGHALEAEGGFERLTHGEAVALGLVAAMKVGEAQGLTERALTEALISVLERLDLPTSLAEQPLTQALHWVDYDKKRAGEGLRFVVIEEPGRARTVKLAPARLGELLGV